MKHMRRLAASEPIGAAAVRYAVNQSTPAQPAWRLYGKSLIYRVRESRIGQTGTMRLKV
jgi:hypothetical protein